ncbi:MAG: CBS domain-containing protein [Gammaproteobacteria bacterium]|nr:CBS domain-containing protein [Gammaproteobacteria bacterium]
MSEHKLIQVREIMKSKFFMVDGLMTVEEAILKMRDEGARPLIVSKRHVHDELGMVLLGDIARKVLAKDRPPKRVNLYEIMNKPVITVSPDMDVRYCARLFERHDLSHAPVIEGGEVVGVISMPQMVLNGLASIGISDEQGKEA